MKKFALTVDTILGNNLLCKEKKDGDGAGTPGAGASASPEKEKISEDNIEKAIDDGIRISEEAAAEAAALIQKQNKDRRVDEMKNIILRSEYNSTMALLRLRKSRKQEKSTKKLLDESAALLAEVKAGKHDKLSYKAAASKLRETQQKEFREIDKWYEDYYTKTKALYPGYWCYEWDNDFACF